MEIVSLEHPDEYFDYAIFPHLLLNCGVFAEVDEYVEGHKEQLILLANQNVELPEFDVGLLRGFITGCLPKFDILAIAKVKSINLVLQNIDTTLSYFMLNEIFVELLVV